MASHSSVTKSDTPDTTFRRIGNGSFGVVFADPTATTIYKRELRAGDRDCLWNMPHEYAMHKRIATALHKWSSQTDLQVEIPEPQDLILEEAADWWMSNASRFPPDEPRYQRPAPTLVAERICSLPGVLRQQLIDKFCPASLRKTFTPDQQDICLVRIYLGRRSRRRTPDAHRPSLKMFAIRNFPGHIDQLETLGLDPEFIATQIGKALAILHFEALTDGKDVEFVLGKARPPLITPSTKEPTPPLTPLATPTTYTFSRDVSMTDIRGPNRGTSIWCLDFNQCQSLSFATPAALSTSVVQCVDAYFLNDPYYPRPDQVELWAAFKANYEATADRIIRDKFSQGHEIQERPDRNEYTALLNRSELSREIIRAIETRFQDRLDRNLL